MPKRPDQIKLSLGAAAHTRRRVLIALAAAIQATGRNGVPSVSEMLSRIADAAEHDMERTAYLISEVMIVAAEAGVLAVEEMQNEAAKRLDNRLPRVLLKGGGASSAGKGR